ncbi:2Fe-2S iron-sulfur cluster-binding protein [Polymorphobacter fuscus]|uniref:2Fe-2S iron-sulfur cluster binding domain-containing protein n=1 Tax=Sandarakinorhabdus fusca TaxID=1439888 RepID=A0A7C9GP85_9SPHN|nr:2Fe-2S iron-sulfur cluster-binding protein [Polymorphobacter fuscus]KAB7646156.1 2Fe-2S iron-sulfur cluster binding domain-containing protein [Polymorphobacter fuscus]MQT17357.1 2Fe-2S iron-sulfur cluster binding domain-containing protein [Polymorphobacter fuscus]NJC10109.1 2Fe-2S ferredoxin [Polymorphobacter fuscus]
MARITYVEFNGTAHSVEVANGVSLMEGAISNGVPGIDGDCGGNAACATCHVYVDGAWTGKTGTPNEMEDAMLDLADGKRDNSRLACQILASDDLDGLVIEMPETQH